MPRKNPFFLRSTKHETRNTKCRVIGLLGGSFNPAHAGHVHISQYALDALGIDEVWWLVSPQNPLKAPKGQALYEKRLQSAREMAEGHRRILVSDIEKRAGLRYTHETIAYLLKKYPSARFVWMMGADNLAQFHRWQRWEWLLRTIPIIVFDRVPYSHTAMRSRAALRGRPFLLKNSDMSGFYAAPAFGFIRLKRDPSSSTQIRKKLGN